MSSAWNGSHSVSAASARSGLRKGFTLFEMIVAITVVVMLVGVMASTLMSGFKMKRSAEDAVENVRDVQTVAQIVVEELQNAVPPWTQSIYDAATNPTSTQSSSSNVSGGIVSGAPSLSGSPLGGMGGTTTTESYLFGPFHGDPQQITFYSSGPEPKATIQTGVHFVQFGAMTFKDSPDGLASLVRCVETNLLSDLWDPTNPDTSGLTPEVLINHVIDIRFTYLSPYDNSWYNQWYSEDNGDSLPLAVKMELTLGPLHDGGQNRTITRVATLWCANPNADASTAATQSTTPGLGN